MNLYKYDYKDLTSEIVDVVYEDSLIRVERIVSMGHTTPDEFIYDQCENEFVSVIDGEAELLLFDSDERIYLKKGDTYMIRSGVKHKVTYTSSPCIWLCIFEKRSNA